MSRMFAVRYVALAAIVVWVGGMVALSAFVAPTAFHVLQAADPAGGRVLAGLVLADILQLFHLIAYACGGIAFASLWVMKFVGPPPSWFLVRSAIVAVMLALMLYSGIPLSREIEDTKKRASGPVHDTAASDARHARFEALYRTSTTVMTIDTGLGLILLLWYVREASL
jgi:hypothetical protein